MLRIMSWSCCFKSQCKCTVNFHRCSIKLLFQTNIIVKRRNVYLSSSDSWCNYCTFGVTPDISLSCGGARGPPSQSECKINVALVMPGFYCNLESIYLVEI